jgi:hypothetical protein
MSKLVVALLVSTVIAMVIMILVVPFYLKNAVQYTNPNYSQIEQNSDESYTDKINTMLQKAGSNIEDEEMHRFYNNLIKDYGLESSSSDTAQSEAENNDNVLPDFQKIFNTSLTSPFREAAKDITDEDLAEVYHDILKGVLDTTPSSD